MRKIKDYSKCCLCGSSVLDKRLFVPFKNKSVCYDCIEELHILAYKEDIHLMAKDYTNLPYSIAMAKARLLKHAESLDW